MAELLARGLRARPNLLDSAVTSASPGGDPAGGMGEFEKGLRSNLAAQSASALNSEGLKAEAAGRPDLAAEKYRQADMFSAEAQTFVPRVRSIRDIGGVQDALDFASGGLPQAVTSMAPTLAGALVGRGIGGRIGGVAGGLVPAYNLEADEAMGALARDPQARSRMTADQLVNLGRGKGAINSALEVAGPAYLLERALGKRVAGSGMKEALKTVGVGGLIEGPLTELPQEVVGQGVQSYARTGDATKEIDPWGLADATALGALGGHAAAMPAAGVQYARGAAADAASKGKELAQSGMDAVRGGAAAAIDLAPKDSEPVLSTLRGRAGSMMDQAKVNWLAGTDSTIPDEIASNPEAVMQHLADQDNQRKSTVAEYLNSVATNEEAHPDRRAQAADMLSRLDDPETFRAAANMVAGAEKVKGYAARVNDLLSDAKDFGAGFVAGNKKANAQRPEGLDKLPATEQLVTQTLLDGLSPEALEGGADQLVPLFRGMFTGKLPGTITSRVMRDFIGTYGDRAPDVASKIAPYIRRDAEDRGMDPAATVSAFQKFMADNEARMDTRREAISTALTNDARLRIQTELGRPMNEGDLSVVSDLMTRLTEGSLSKAMAPKVEAELKSYLGDRYKQTMNVFRALHDAEAQNEAVLAHAGDDIEDRAATHSFETMMEGVNRQWSLAKKADESGVAPLFDSREEAQKRWDENIAPKYPGFQGSVVTGDQYATVGGIDPLALASQYDEKFKTAPSDYKDMAQHLKDAMALLRTKHVVQMDMVSNNDADVMTEKEVQRVFAKSVLPVEQVEKPGSNENGRYYHFTDGGKTFRRDSKPTVADGYVFVHVGERARPVKVSALDYVMRGKQQKESFGGTADEQVGADAQIRRALMGIARLGDAGVVNMEAGVFGYDVKGNKRWIIAPTKDGGKSKFPETLKMGQATFRELAAEREGARKKEEVEYWAPRIERAKNVLEENSRMDEALVKAAMRAVDRAEKRLSAAHSPFAKAQAARALSAAVDYLNDIPGHLAREWQKESESKRGADQFDSTDTDPMLSDEEVSRGEAEDEANFADVQRRTREQERSARKEIAKRSNIQKTPADNTSGELAKQIEAKLAEQSATITSKATGAIDYMNSGEADPEMVARIGAWVDKQYARTNDPDAISLLNDLKKLVGQQTPRKKSNAMSADIHNDLGKEGFGATHDSPIRHEGKFNWREHIGKGEGNAAFGAGTYLSTADGVHQNYKRQFTASLTGDKDDGVQMVMNAYRRLRDAAAAKKDALQTLEFQLERSSLEGPAKYVASLENSIAAVKAMSDAEVVRRAEHKSPTYHVTVNAKPEELLDWDAPLSEQSEKVQNALRGLKEAAPAVVRDIVSGDIVESVELSGETIYKNIAKKLGSQAKASDYLQSLGIVGHKYNSEGSRNSKFPNYVIYDDSRIETNYVSFSKQQSGKAATDAEVQEAKDYIHKVLGRKIKAEFVDSLGGISGEWEETDAANIIRIALNAGPGVRSVAHHEAMHEFMDRLMKRGTADVAQTLKNVAASPTVRKRLEVLLRNEPEALKQIRNDAEERVAYMYQFWAAGKLQVGPKAESLFERIKAFFRKITGMITESEKAEAMLAAFHRGDFAKLSGFGKAVRAAANEDATASTVYKQLAPLARRAAELVYTSEGVLTSHDNATLDKLAAMFNTGANSTSRGQGYLNAKAQEMNRWLNRFNSAIEGLERDELDAIRDALRAEKMPSTQHLRAPAREIRAILDEFHDYVTAAGVPLKHLRNYFPQVWDTHEIMSRNNEFKDLLLKHHEDVLSQIAERGNKERLDQLEVKIKTAAPEEVEALEAAHEEMQQNPQTAEDVAETIVQRLLSGNGVDPLTEDENRVGYTPLMGALNKRTLNFIDKEAFSDFFEKDTVRIMSNYLSQGVHRAEYARRFNNDGSGITNMLTAAFDEEVKKNEAAGDDAVAAMQKATATIESAKRAVMAMEGTLGHDITPVMRRFSSYMMVYQNMRILPLALFSSLIDPMGLAVRGGTLNDSLNGLRRGVKEIVNQIKGEYSSDEITKLAETIGTVDNAAFMDALGETYSSIYMTGWAKKLNDKIFHWNGMESWNRGMRIAATQAAIEFIKRNVENPGPHSERWLAELGLKPADVVIKDGKLEVLEGPNLNAIQAHRTQAAIQRWVDSAVLRPNAAQRPPWASDPHYALLFHMKQFTYSFQKTILARVTNEWREGNLMPAVALAWYVPMMIAADMVKAVLQGMGDEPEYMKGWTVQDYVSRGVQRAGLLGVGQFGMDAYNMGAESILGPTAEQAVDALKDPIDKTAIDALPVNPLYKNALK